MSSLSNPPESWHKVDSGTLRDVDSWISSGHPGECDTRVNSLLTNHDFKYLTTAQKLVAHCVEHHGDGIQTIAKLCQHYFPIEPEKVGLTRSIQFNQARLVDEILAKWKSLDMQNENSQAVALVASSIDDVYFRRIWKSTWRFYCQARWKVRKQLCHRLQSSTIHFPLLSKISAISELIGLHDLARDKPVLAGALFRVAAFLPSRSSYATDLIDQSSEELFQIIPYDLIFSLIWSPQLGSQRAGQLESLLSRHGVIAAKAIITHSQWAKEVPPCVSTATKVFLNSKPDDPVTTVGVGLCLQIDPNFAIPIIVDWVNTGKSSQHYDQFFRWKVGQSDQRELFRALALDAVKRDPHWHHALAGVHQNLITQSDHVLEWLSETVSDHQASRYNASLVSAYLSETRKKVTPEQSNEFIRFAHLLHEKYGSQTKERALMASKVTYPKLKKYEELVAIALARDVIFPSRIIDGAKTLRTIKQLSFTYEALGGEQLDKAIGKGEFFPYAVFYEINAKDEINKLEAQLKSGEIDLDEFKWKVGFPQRALKFTATWEDRFAKISKAGINPSRNLRTDENVWSEIRILTQLVDHFDVVYEPINLPGMGSSRPDFFLKSTDGDLILEVATISQKPEDVREAVTTSFGGDVKKTLQSKWRKQFHECQGGVTVPIVIAVQTRWSDLGVIDFLNSLYGPLGVTLRMNTKSGEIVEEGTSRNIEQAFFSQPNVKCISAVGRIDPNETYPDYLIGELYRPIEAPQYPLSMKLWVRLRDALFGSVPKNLVDQISKIPGISLEEAETLVRCGVDDISFFGSGLIEFPENLPLSKKRFEELQAMAGRLIQIHRTGRMDLLSSAQGVDLSPLYNQKIYTINQLLQCEQKPDGISEEVWHALRDEAKLM
jgi:hypothetical protein